MCEPLTSSVPFLKIPGHRTRLSIKSITSSRHRELTIWKSQVQPYDLRYLGEFNANNSKLCASQTDHKASPGKSILIAPLFTPSKETSRIRLFCDQVLFLLRIGRDRNVHRSTFCEIERQRERDREIEIDKHKRTIESSRERESDREQSCQHKLQSARMHLRAKSSTTSSSP